MKKKLKGFTLIELLAIIVILAIVLVITIPVITKVVKNANKSAVIESAYGYKDAINKFYATETLKNPNFKLEDGTYNVSDLKNMGVSVNGTEPTEGWVLIEKNEIIEYSLKFDNYVSNYDSDSGTVEAIKDGIIQKKLLRIPTTIGSAVKNFGGYDWHVIGNDSFSVTLWLDGGQIENMSHQTTGDSGKVSYNWQKSQIRNYINGEFLNSLGEIKNELTQHDYICVDDSQNTNSPLKRFGGYLINETPERNCYTSMVWDYVRLIGCSELTYLKNNFDLQTETWINEMGWGMRSKYAVDRIDYGIVSKADLECSISESDYKKHPVRPVIRVKKSSIKQTNNN